MWRGGKEESLGTKENRFNFSVWRPHLQYLPIFFRREQHINLFFGLLNCCRCTWWLFLKLKWIVYTVDVEVFEFFNTEFMDFLLYLWPIFCFLFLLFLVVPARVAMPLKVNGLNRHTFSYHLQNFCFSVGHTLSLDSSGVEYLSHICVSFEDVQKTVIRALLSFFRRSLEVPFSLCMMIVGVPMSG